ncbi:hypothetical protein, partial [Mixta calida]|uniref:hypothetical protein n=1 Tax=Mixta calida TaxID=665913 RepID=UPI00289EDABA
RVVVFSDNPLLFALPCLPAAFGFIRSCCNKLKMRLFFMQAIIQLSNFCGAMSRKLSFKSTVITGAFSCAGRKPVRPLGVDMKCNGTVATPQFHLHRKHCHV